MTSVARQLPLFPTDKRCSKCGETKPLSQFSPRPNRPCGIRSSCKSCSCASTIAWREANPERQQATSRARYLKTRERQLSANKVWCDAHRDKRRADARAWYAANTERAKATSRAWREANIERVRVRGREWHKANADRRHAMWSAWYRANRQARLESIRRWQEENPERRRAISLRGGQARRARQYHAPGSCTAEALAARWAMWGGRCYMCGAEATSTDHVIPLARGGTHWPANLRPACGLCNSRKRARDWRLFVHAGTNS